MGALFSAFHGSSSESSSESSLVLSFHSEAEWLKHFDSIKETDQLMVIDFHATWCAPCRFMEPLLIELASEHREVVFVKIDVDELKEVARKWTVDAMPTFVLVKKGEEINRIIGASKDELLDQIRKHKSS
ncbi:thioredoxin H2-like [Aristolochia californica]|uniref:thioredoxin H2-like n=1 Tax=Aristolochia californica TaxID=171875 RepID=UPI0035DD2CD5